MISAVRLAWLQLRGERARLAIAVAGVAFAVVLVFMQIGFQDALFRSGVVVHEQLDADIVLLSREQQILPIPRQFARRRVYQTLGIDGVARATGVYVVQLGWRNPQTGEVKDILMLGVNPADRVLLLPGIEANRALLRLPDVVLFDELSRPEYGPVPALFREAGRVETEMNRRHVTVRGLFELPNSFAVDGMLVTSDINFLRIVPFRPPGAVNIGLVRVRSGADVEAVRAAIQADLPKDILVLTKAGYMAREARLWATLTPVGFVFGFGVLMGFVVGGVIVYQILFADITDHLPEYATLKAMGYGNRFLGGVVLVEAGVLAVLGYLPGFGLGWWLYGVTRAATGLQMEVTPARAVEILGLAIAMCAISGLLASRKLRAVDPAEIF